MPNGSAISQSASGKYSTIKDPNATLDYPFDWTDWILDVLDAVNDHAFIITNPAAATVPMTLVSSQFTATGLVTGYVSGGTPGQTHQLTCRIMTAAGRIDERTLHIKMKEL